MRRSKGRLVSAQWSACLGRLTADLSAFRMTVDEIVQSADPSPRDWRRLLFETLICSSKLYLDYLLFVRECSVVVEAVGGRGERGTSSESSVAQEMELRKKLRYKLDSSPGWKNFTPENPFSKITGLWSLQDYFDRFVLHLPEIWSETIHAEALARDVLESFDKLSAARLSVALQHLGRNHISFVLQALEWACDENNWKGPSGSLV